MVAPDERGRGRRLVASILTFGLVGALGLARPAQASPAFLAIRSITITNVSDTGFTVSWVTDQSLPGSGSVDYGTSPTGLASQTSEVAPVPGARGDVHSVSVRSLNASTTYYFSVSDAGVFSPPSGYVYKASTGPALQNVSSGHPATGQVFQSDGRTPAAGALVTVRVLDNANLNGTSPTTSAPLSTFTNAQGTWALTVTPRTADNASVFNFSTSGSDFLLVTAEGGSLGAVYPAQSTPIRLDNSGNVVAASINLGGGVNPAETPVAVQMTATSTGTPTDTAVPSPTRESVATPGGTTTAGGSPRAGSTATPTRTPVVIPTVAIPTRVLPPASLTVAPPRTAPAPVTPRSSGPFAAPPIRPALPTVTGPVSPAAPLATSVPTLPAAATRVSAMVLSPTASPTSAAGPSPVVPSANSSGAAGATEDPLHSLPLVVSGGLALVGLGLVMSVIGFVDQRRDG